MAKEKFVEIAFRTKTRKLIAQANEIINEMQAKGFTLTVRQLYYQFVARGLLENRQTNYQRLDHKLLDDLFKDTRAEAIAEWIGLQLDGCVEVRLERTDHIAVWKASL